MIESIKFSRRRPLTDRLFRSLCFENPDLRLERTALGELVVMTPAGAGSGGRNARIIHQLMNWNEIYGSGIVFDSSAGFTLPNGAIRSPDASWISWSRWGSLTPDEKEGFAPICPDFVVELRSPTDRLRKLRETLREYLAQGARLGWLIDPRRKVVEVYRGKVEVLVDPPTLSGEDVLPGFILDLKEIFT
jgi:Uma2 family endonuclease